ncbi:EF-hand calcium-binding domain-containing protein 5 [Entophlyctis sp. JEL0112]|nr:EF-hand calcium-binding domain-containing protein 5 [Entophlyctis sp. JEL0112]
MADTAAAPPDMMARAAILQISAPPAKRRPPHAPPRSRPCPRCPTRLILGAPVGVSDSRLNPLTVGDYSPGGFLDAAFVALTADFLNAPDISLELRAYLLEKVVPTVLLALEKLLREADSRGLIESQNVQADFGEMADAPLCTECSARVAQFTAGDGATALARSKDDDSSLESALNNIEPQIDKPLSPIPFNPINWLAQFIYRTNPRYIDSSDINNVPYFQQLHTVSQQTKAKLFELQLTQRAQQRAAALAQKRDRERLKRARTQQMEQTRALFEQLLSTVFKKWTGKLWRIVNGTLEKQEMISVYKAIRESQTIQATDSMIHKVTDLINYITMSPEVAESLLNRQILTAVTPPTKVESVSNEISGDNFPTSSSISRHDSTQIEGTPDNGETAAKAENRNSVGRFEERSASHALVALPVEYLAASKWDRSAFVDAHLLITGASSNPGTIPGTDTSNAGGQRDSTAGSVSAAGSSKDSGWTLADVSTFVLAVAAQIDTEGAALEKAFANVFVAPEAITRGATTRAEWRLAFARAIVDFDSAAGIKASLIDYCRGIVTLAQLGVTNGVSDDDHAARTSIAVPPRASIAAAYSGDRRESAGSGWAVPVATVQRDSLEDYRKFMMVMAGLYGIDAVTDFFGFLSKREAEAQAALEAASAHAVVKVTAEELQSRLTQLQSLFLLLPLYEDAQQTTADIFTNAIEKVITLMDLKLSPQLALRLTKLKYSGTRRELQKTIVSADTLGQRVTPILLELDNVMSDDFMAVLKLLFETVAADMTGGAAVKTIAKTVEAAVLPSAVPRLEIETAALAEVAAFASRSDMSIAEFCDAALLTVSRAIERLHPEHRVSSRVTLAESGISGVATAPQQQDPDAQQMAVVERFLRVVACSTDCRTELLGASFSIRQEQDVQAYEAKVMATGKTFKGPDGEFDPVATFTLSDDRVARFVGVPLVSSSSGKPVGVMALNLIGIDDKGYAPHDFEFLEKAAATIITAVEHIDARERMVQIAQASLQYMREKIGDSSDVTIYIHQAVNGKPTLFKILNPAFSPIVKDPRSLDSAKASSREKEQAAAAAPATGGDSDGDVAHALAFARYTAGASGRLSIEKVMDDAYELPFVQQATQTKDIISVPSESDSQITETYVPIVDDEDAVFAVVSVRPKAGKGEVSDEDLAELKKIGAVMSACGSTARKEKFGEESVLQHLEGEGIDELSRRNLLFPKMMLIAARNWLSKLDNKSISELRSYKKPPVAVMKVLKAVLYLFGKKPKEVSQWSDILKFVNADLLKAMIGYDPTAIQKKIRFKRCNKVLFTLSKTDVKKKTSIPTVLMFDWLIVSLDLRRRAVEARKRHPLAFAEETKGGDAETEDGDADAADADAEAETLADGDSGGGADGEKPVA